ncbi:Os01g0676066 [Oryza sativa Japonica Group]|uniref:Os01g0676066 protein n=1 Tax=Oryza sativa subsp. japonica TaxID=39947 RepID=A0A0P0V6J0_ORYSJ|nr:Os01g0676066 [Oryza sativa Japonica Group]
MVAEHAVEALEESDGMAKENAWGQFTTDRTWPSPTPSPATTRCLLQNTDGSPNVIKGSRAFGQKMLLATNNKLASNARQLLRE